MAGKAQMLQDELTMLTGIVTTDLDYLAYCVLKGGTYFKKEERPKEEEIYNAYVVSNRPQSFKDWFTTLEKFEE